MNQTRELKHAKVFTCKRYRMLTYLGSKGFVPFMTVSEPDNPKYLNWIFENSPELEDAIDEYFAMCRARKAQEKTN